MAQSILIQNINKVFKKTRALDQVSLEIRPGEIFGLLGLNGAGKTTLLKCLMKLMEPDSGEIFFKERLLSSLDIQKTFGFLPENFLPPPTLSAQELLKIMSWGFHLPPQRVDICLGQVGMKEQKNKLIKAYSRGMIQRLGLAIAMLKDPEVIILDEPTLGLDPLGQSQILQLLTDLNRQGKTIFFSSHILSQMEKVCQRIGIIHQGKIKFLGTVKEIIRKHGVSSLEEAFLLELKNKN
ncbi:MAG: ABC transporter ATP-binding protein [Candidatus Omnitrophota bacterium]